MDKYNELSEDSLQIVNGGNWVRNVTSSITSAYHQFSRGLYDGFHHRN